MESGEYSSSSTTQNRSRSSARLVGRNGPTDCRAAVSQITAPVSPLPSRPSSIAAEPS